MNKYFKEAVLWSIIGMPYLYLARFWNDLPQKFPIHFNFSGQPDNWANKQLLLILPISMGVGIYLLLLLAPIIDPKKKLVQMGHKYYFFRFMLTFFFSLLITYILHTSKTGKLNHPHLLFTLIGFLFAIVGNYLQIIRPNYFFGIRTPCTLENESVWQKTHRLSSRIWMAAGVTIAILSFLISTNTTLAIISSSIILLAVALPIIFSYFIFQKEKSIHLTSK